MKKLLLLGGVMLSIYVSPSHAQPCFSAPECAAVRQQAQARQAQIVAQQQAQAEAYARQQRDAAREAEANRQQAAVNLANARAAQEERNRQAVIEQDERNRQAEIDLANARVAQEARNRQAAIDLAAQVEVQRLADLAKKEASEDAAAQQLAAEQSPDNHCHEPKVAGKLIVDFNQIRGAQDYNMQAVDIDHLVTMKYDSPGIFICHGAFVLQNGHRITGSLLSKLNVAGSSLVSFKED